MARASKPRTQPRIKGRYASADAAAMRKQELAERKADAAFAKLPKKPTQDRFKDAALAVRKAQTKGRRDSGARALAKATGRNVTHRTFRSADAARTYIDGLKGKKSKLVWWGVTARDEEGTLFSYQLAVSTPDLAGIELDNAQTGALPTGGLRKTDLKVKEAVRSADTRITVSVLNLNPPKKEASNASTMGSRTRTKKPAGDRSNGKRSKNKPSGNRPRKLAATGKGKRTRAPSKRAKKSR